MILCTVLAVIFAVASVLSVSTDLFSIVPQSVFYVLYICSAIAMFTAVWAIVKFLKSGVHKRKINGLLCKNKYTAKLADDAVYRTVAMTYLSFGVNAAMGLAKAAAGIFLRSYWLITFAAYYILLCVIRMFLLKTNRSIGGINDKNLRETAEWKAYGICGFLFMAMTVILQGAIVLILKDGHGFKYEGFLIYAVAAYDFYCLISSIVYMVRKSTDHTPVIRAIKIIKLSTSLVSMLSLQTAMFASFGNGGDFQSKMNFIVGTSICVLIFLLGMFMVFNSRRKIKKNEV